MRLDEKTVDEKVRWTMLTGPVVVWRDPLKDGEFGWGEGEEDVAKKDGMRFAPYNSGTVC